MVTVVLMDSVIVAVVADCGNDSGNDCEWCGSESGEFLPWMFVSIYFILTNLIQFWEINILV